MNTHIAALVEAAKLARQELATVRDPAQGGSAESAVRRLTELLESEAVSDALVVLDRVDDAPSMKSDPPVDLRVPYPWRAHRRSHLPQRT
jgi:hypothetical protein